MADGEVTLTGRTLEVVGLQPPELLPEQALLLLVEEAELTVTGLDALRAVARLGWRRDRPGRALRATGRTAR